MSYQKIESLQAHNMSQAARSEIVAAILGFSLVLFIFCNGCAVGVSDTESFIGCILPYPQCLNFKGI